MLQEVVSLVNLKEKLAFSGFSVNAGKRINCKESSLKAKIFRLLCDMHSVIDMQNCMQTYLVNMNYRVSHTMKTNG